MEKVVSLLFSDLPGDALRDELLTRVLPALRAHNWVHTVRLTVADSDVEPADAKRMGAAALPCAVLSLWLDEARRLSEVQPLWDDLCSAIHSYQVVEAEPLVNARTPADGVTRGEGFCQLALIKRPQTMDLPGFIAVWQGSHTRIAIDTQSTFGYRQNRVVNVLSDGAPDWDAIVEEDFPEAAMTSDHAFYAASDDAQLQQRQEAMMSSCARFIDFEHICVVPMSEYLSRPARP
ncbi:EthD domain-containing protein [Parahalioglobus pacificus]|uniref:EthD domain-containing protein n=1 Tax=Parahalioglobus pacificus TaxID=930806 RepID=A0A918XCU3_9GAMM|nr:EthD domain-containing protein [Halioglobus pacificus]NQY02617.1 EthD domain-containing protein [Halieaceae bacterium]GHD26333.1 hypothetical protein GCM10007053_03140 [Halioglobus pacificus]